MRARAFAADGKGVPAELIEVIAHPEAAQSSGPAG
jgi:hypothetical protein